MTKSFNLRRRGGHFIANRGFVGAKAVVESVIALRGFSTCTAFYHHARARGRGNPKGFFCTMEFATTRKIDNTIWFRWIMYSCRWQSYLIRLVFAFNATIAIQGGPSASGKKYVDIKFKVPSLAWVIGWIYSWMQLQIWSQHISFPKQMGHPVLMRKIKCPLHTLYSRTRTRRCHANRLCCQHRTTWWSITCTHSPSKTEWWLCAPPSDSGRSMWRQFYIVQLGNP